jgi:hypothetical protein
MPTLWIAEYDMLSNDGVGNALPIPREPAIAEQTVTFTTTVASAAFNAKTTYVRLIADADCHLHFDDAPVATTAKQFVPANTEVFRRVRAGDKVAAVAA